jgi:hypothetical protein
METMDKISVSDLSVGDWVQAKMTKWDYEDLDITPSMKVVKIEKDCVRLGFSLDDLEFEVFVEDLQPIPITVEVLEKNGLEYVDDDNDAVIFLCCDMFWARLCVGDTFWQVGIHSEDRLDAVVCNVKHIHELQHALRLASVGKEIVS